MKNAIRLLIISTLVVSGASAQSWSEWFTEKKQAASAKVEGWKKSASEKYNAAKDTAASYFPETVKSGYNKAQDAFKNWYVKYPALATLGTGSAYVASNAFGAGKYKTAAAGATAFVYAIYKGLVKPGYDAIKKRFGKKQQFAEANEFRDKLQAELEANERAKTGYPYSF